MVVIINGEIVPDNDPRAIARRGGNSSGGGNNSQKGTTGGAQQQRRVVSFGDLGSSSSGGGRQQQQQGQGQNRQQEVGGDVDGLLTPLSRVLGIVGRRFVIPPIPQIGFTGAAIPLVHLVVSALVMLVMGNWRYSIVSLIALSFLNPITM